jgi:hypothetical protein
MGFLDIVSTVANKFSKIQRFLSWTWHMYCSKLSLQSMGYLFQLSLFNFLCIIMTRAAFVIDRFFFQLSFLLKYHVVFFFFSPSKKHEIFISDLIK